MKKYGTSSLVVAAFVGPGTVLTCAAAGVSYSYVLGWVLVLSTIAVFVLQSFAAGTGILAGRGLGEAIRMISASKWYRIPLATLVVIGLWMGSAAFETGNIAGAAAGIQLLAGTQSWAGLWSLFVAASAAIILSLNLHHIRNVLTGIVALMSAFFIGSAIVAPVDWPEVINGLVIPTIPDGSIITVLALVGTTVVTYNLFLHAGLVKQFWKDVPKVDGFKMERRGMLFFLPVGGLISVAIMVAGASASAQEATVSSIAGFANVLQPVAGKASHLLFGLGLVAAGLTSAVTAPLAVAAGISELFGWPESAGPHKYRWLWASVLVSGFGFSITGYSPLDLIIAAQAANGFLLPIMAGILVYVTLSQREISLPRYFKVAGITVVLFCVFLGIKTLYWVWVQVGF